jgi:hypothetical protein
MNIFLFCSQHGGWSRQENGKGSWKIWQRWKRTTAASRSTQYQWDARRTTVCKYPVNLPVLHWFYSPLFRPYKEPELLPETQEDSRRKGLVEELPSGSFPLQVRNLEKRARELPEVILVVMDAEESEEIRKGKLN